MSELPAGWVHAEIGDLCNLINGRAFKPQEWSESGLPIIRIQNLNNPEAKFNHFSGALDGKHHVRSGDLLFAWSGTPGTSFGAHIWHGGDAALNQHIFKIEFSDLEIDRGFLRYAINQKLDELIGSAQGGVGLRHVTKGTFEKTEIAFPPRAEQTRIAAKLDELLAQVDTLKARIDGIPALLKRFRQSVLAAAVSGRLTEEWRGSPVGSYAFESLGKLVAEPLRNGKSVKDGNGQRVLRLSALKQEGIDFLESKAGDWAGIDPARYLVKTGDFLISRGNGSKDLVGRGGLVGSEVESMAYPDTMIRVRPHTKKLNPRYLAVIWNSHEVRKQIESTARTTAGIWKISQGDLEAVQIPLPPIEEQTEIVRRIEQLFAFADQLEARVKAAQARIDRLTQSILAKAFRGELVPQDPTDEPASALLERIQAQRTSAPKVRRKRRVGAD